MRITCVESGGPKSSRMWSMSTMVPANMANWILWDPGTAAKRGLDRWLLGWICATRAPPNDAAPRTGSTPALEIPGEGREMDHNNVKIGVPNPIPIFETSARVTVVHLERLSQPHLSGYWMVLMHCSWHLVVGLLTCLAQKNGRWWENSHWLPQNKLKL